MTARPCSITSAAWGWKASCRSKRTRPIAAGHRRCGSSRRTRQSNRAGEEPAGDFAAALEAGMLGRDGLIASLTQASKQKDRPKAVSCRAGRSDQTHCCISTTPAIGHEAYAGEAEQHHRPRRGLRNAPTCAVDRLPHSRRVPPPMPVNSRWKLPGLRMPDPAANWQNGPQGGRNDRTDVEHRGDGLGLRAADQMERPLSSKRRRRAR